MHSFGMYLYRFFHWSQFDVTPKWQDQLCARTVCLQSQFLIRLRLPKFEDIYVRAATFKHVQWPGTHSILISAVNATGQLNPLRSVLLPMAASQLIKNFPASYEIRRSVP